MKTYLLGILCLAGSLNAQTFSDNFDSYSAGQKLAIQSAGAWTTWSDAPGGTEDAMVVNDKSSSAPNAVYFSSTLQAGGPTDLVRNFGVLNTGEFTMNMDFYVVDGKAAYFNLQRNATIGDVWALDVNFGDNGKLTLDDNSRVILSVDYPQGKWFNFRIDINFNLNVWEVFLDGFSAGKFTNKENQIASIDIFPTDATTPYASEFYMDNFQYTITPYTLPAVNAALTYITYDGGSLVGSTAAPKVRLRNLGTAAINAVDLTVNYNGVDYNENFSGLNLASLAEQDITLTQPLSWVPGAKTVTATISNVNGAGADGDSGDNTISMIVDPVIPAFGKLVLGEEGTGTWCQWCPRGAVYMDKMESLYHDNWAGVAVHNNDPMTLDVYDAGLGGLISGYPSALVDRGLDADPSAMEADFLVKVKNAPVAILQNESVWDSGTRTLTVTVRSNFLMAADNTYNLACIITEDDVTGTTADYAQVNAYAGGGNGEMGGYESLPNPVPASLMVYNHVGRLIETSFTGQSNVYPAVVNAGDVHDYVFTMVLPTEVDETKINVVSVIFNPDGTVNNAGRAKFDASVAASTTDVTVTCGAAVDVFENTDGNKVPNVLSGVSFTSDCPGGIVSLSQNLPVGAILVPGANSVYVMAKDECGNTKYCVTTVNLIDNTSATIDCGSSVTMTHSVDGNAVPNLSAMVTASTTCGLGGQAVSQTPAAGSKLMVGTNTITVTVTDACGNSSSCTKTVNYIDDLAAGITELEHNNLLVLYPNPAFSVLNYTSQADDAIKEIQIYSADGKLVYTTTISQQNLPTSGTEGAIPVSGLSRGIYTLKFTTKSGALGTQKFTKE